MGLTTFIESILQVVIDRGQATKLDFIGLETGNFGLFGDDEDVEYSLTLDGTLVPGFEKWMGLTQPLREPVRQQSALSFPSGGTLELFARLPGAVLEGGIGDGLNSFDVRAVFGLWFIPG